MRLLFFAGTNRIVRRIGALAVLGALWQGGLQPQVLTTEYIHAGGRVVAAVHTPPPYFTDSGLASGGTYAQFLDDANLMKAYGITGGTGLNTFSPSLVLTRDNAAVFVIRAIYVALLGPGHGDSFTYGSSPYFTDVPSTYPYFKWIQKMSELGITAGCGSGNYCPTTALTNAGMAVFTARARQYVLTNGVVFTWPAIPQYFDDEPSSDLYYSFIQDMASLGVVTRAAGSFGCSMHNYCPSSSILRAPATAFVVHGILNDWSF